MEPGMARRTEMKKETERNTAADVEQILLRYLHPTGTPAGEGMCPDCHQVLPLLQRNRYDPKKCRVCFALTQQYPTAGSKPNRIVYSHLLLTEQSALYVGKYQLWRVNREIKCVQQPLPDLLKSLFHNPPSPPWILISFDKSGISRDQLRVTKDNAHFEFSGKLSLAGKEVRSIDRDQVLQMYKVGMQQKDWSALFSALQTDSAEAQKKIDEMFARFPVLLNFFPPDGRYRLPPVGSPEIAVLNILLRGKK